jgi:hypothetical protein
MMFPVGQSGNPKGRVKLKYSAVTVKGYIERFLHHNLTPTKLQRIFNKLSAKDQLELITALLPYYTAKQQPDSISASDVDKLYEELMNLKEDKKVTGMKVS